MNAFRPDDYPQLTEAKVILHSRHPDGGPDLVTVEATMHRFVLAELNTHRDFSRNSQSSRAIPVVTQLARIGASPAFPLAWPQEQSGMSGGDTLDGGALAEAKELLGDIASYAFNAISAYVDRHPEAGTRLHKSALNRPLEWFSWHRVIITSCRWENFFEQRCSPKAQPEFEAVARAIEQAISASQGDLLEGDDWHLPYVTPEERRRHDDSTLRRISASRCAGVSYLNHDRDPDVRLDLDRYERLATADPPHFSPFEHVATPATSGEVALGNLAPHWRQMRHDRSAW
jgi:hypothetical protein